MTLLTSSYPLLTPFHLVVVQEEKTYLVHKLGEDEFWAKFTSNIIFLQKMKIII